MTKHIAITAACLGLLLSTGCTSVNRSAQVNPIAMSVDATLEAKIDVDTSQRVKGIASQTWVFCIFTSGPSKFAEGYSGFVFADKVTRLKNAALYNALEGTGCDRLVDPQYTVTKTSGFFVTTISVEVTGYKASVRGVRQLDRR